MSTQSLSTHPELAPCGLGAIAFVGAAFGRLLGTTWAEHHPRHAHRARAAAGRHHRR